MGAIDTVRARNLASRQHAKRGMGRGHSRHWWPPKPNRCLRKRRRSGRERGQTLGQNCTQVLRVGPRPRRANLYMLGLDTCPMPTLTSATQRKTPLNQRMRMNQDNLGKARYASGWHHDGTKLRVKTHLSTTLLLWLSYNNLNSSKEVGAPLR